MKPTLSVLVLLLMASSTLTSGALSATPSGTQRATSPHATHGEASDSDGDGLSDAFEASLLARFSPYFLYSTDDGPEPFRPTDAIWYIRHSELLSDGDEQSTPVISNAILSNTPSAILGANVPFGSSDLGLQREKTNYYINPQSNCSRHGYCPGTSDPGFDWPEIQALGSVGLYGHVVPYGPLIKIEYWQFFGFSTANASNDTGDHEGDWITVQLLYDPNDDVIHKVFHYSHGKEMAFEVARAVGRFDLSSDVQEFRGPNYDISDINLDQRTIKDELQDNLVRFFRDPMTGRYEHPLAYIERGSHEPWPSEHWSFPAVPNHNGQAYRYLSGNASNLGEFESPSSPDAEIILHFNGKWGAFSRDLTGIVDTSPPPGPAIHTEWTWLESDATKAELCDSRRCIFEDQATSWHFGPPVAVAGPDRTIECSGGVSAIVLDGGASYDRDTDDDTDDILFYNWSGSGIATFLPGKQVVVHMPLGQYQYALHVGDGVGSDGRGEGTQSLDVINIAVVDRTAPQLSCPPSLTLECSGPLPIPSSDPRIVQFLTQFAATDACDPSIAKTLMAPQEFGLGTSLVTFTATDHSGNSQTCQAAVNVVDTHPPDLAVSVSPEELRPPNHKLVAIRASIEVKDLCDPNPTIVLASIASNEQVLGAGAGKTTPDVVGAELGTDDRDFELRAERSGTGWGRTYTVCYTARDASGNRTTVCDSVIVPHDRGAKRIQSISNGAALLALGCEAYPNPSVGNVTIAFTLPTTAHVSLSLHDVAGRKVVQLVDDVVPSGVHSVSWAAARRESSPGVYLYRLRVGEHAFSGRIFIAR